MPSHPITISRTIYDPAIKNFVFNSLEGKSLPNIKHWIIKKNPVIYWYILRIDNSSELQLDQWAVELYTHRALSITEAYIDGIDRRFELEKGKRDHWSSKYLLAIPRGDGIPIVGRGTRRIFFKVDINNREGLMQEYCISGQFIAEGIKSIDVREKKFRYSCTVYEFRKILDINPEDASIFAEKRLSNRFSSSSVQVFTNSFRMIHDLYRYCHSNSIERENLLNQLNLLNSNFEKVPEIASERITPLLNRGIKELSIVDTSNISEFKSRYLRLCDSLVEFLHLEVVSSNEQTTPPENYIHEKLKGDFKTVNGQLICPVCKNKIDSSNRSLLCGECGVQLCQFCECWFREERKRGEGPLCKKCFIAKQELLKNQINEESFKMEKYEQKMLRKQLEVSRKLEGNRKADLSQAGNSQNTDDFINSIGMEFIKIQTGEFIMGHPSDEKAKENNRGPIHKVTIKKPFYLGRYEVTQKQWRKVMGSNPSNFKGDDFPVDDVFWDSAQEFIKKLNQMEGTNKYRLPSEAEWEYACRAGTTTRFCFGDDESKLGDYAWYRENSGFETHPVGQKKPNPWGLHDMHGNVWEWCLDRWNDNYEGAPSDGSSRVDKGYYDYHVRRGGQCCLDAEHCESAERWYFALFEYLGFRVIMNESEEDERLRKNQEEEWKIENKIKDTYQISSSQNSDNFINSIGMHFVKIQSGDFMMGSSSGEKDREDNEGPVHRVIIRTPFLLGKFPVTQKQWEAIMGSNHSCFKGDDLPVENVSWYDVQDFIKKLNQKEGTDKYRLPSEAEWEYACRAGTTTSYYFGDDESKLGDYAWYDYASNNRNFGIESHSVGQKKPNPMDLYDIHGNVWEWCQDTWHDSYDDAPSDGSAWEDESSSNRVHRGGSWFSNYRLCRSANRGRHLPFLRYNYLGFRVLRTL